MEKLAPGGLRWWGGARRASLLLARRRAALPCGEAGVVEQAPGTWLPRHGVPARL